MALNPYDSCPCGSGKKYKWCCTGYFDQVTRALEQQNKGQSEGALKTFEDLLKNHGDRPQVWVYYSQILLAQNKPEEMKKAIDKAFSLQPDFPLAYLLLGYTLEEQGDIVHALELFRKAAYHFHPEAVERLSQCYESIAKLEMLLFRPVATRAVMEELIKLNPQSQNLRDEMDYMFGDESGFPDCARKAYHYRPMTRNLPAEGTKWLDAKFLFEKLAEKIPDDPALWFNHGLACAWLGDVTPAIESLKKSVELETDDYRAEEASTLIQVLVLSAGFQEEADYLEYRAELQIRDDRALIGMLQQMMMEQRITPVQVDKENHTASSIFIEPIPSLVESSISMARFQAQLMLAQGRLVLWNMNKEKLEKIVQEIRDRVSLAVSEPNFRTETAHFSTIISEAVCLPMAEIGDEKEYMRRLNNHYIGYYESSWFHAPRRSLGGVTPLDAVGSKSLRKRLLGTLRFHYECVARALPFRDVEKLKSEFGFEFNLDYLRHKLGIDMVSTPVPPTIDDAPPPAPIPTPVAAAPEKPASAPAPAAPVKREVGAMNVAELSALKPDSLSATELEDAMRAAVKLDARELAVHFARAGVQKSADPAKTDRYPFYACLMTAALSEGKVDEALQLAQTGSHYDAEHNGARRANEYTTRRATIYAKKGDLDSCGKEYDQLIERNPDDGNLYVKATEAMLALKQGARAAAFAQRGMDKGKSMNNRDLQKACEELLNASKKYS